EAVRQGQQLRHPRHPAAQGGGTLDGAGRRTRADVAGEGGREADGPDAIGRLVAKAGGAAAGRADQGGGGEGMSVFPSVDEGFGRLHQAGWSVGEVATSGEWIVAGTNGDVDQPYCLLRQ